MDAFDAVVVGAGHNGLAAAIHLLNRGWSVAVVEQAGEPGGAVKTREVTLPGFRHDLCAMNLSLFAGSPFFAAHKEELMAQGLAFAPAADCFASVFRDHTYLGVSKDLETDRGGDRGFVGEGFRRLAGDARTLRRGSAAYLRPARDRPCRPSPRRARYGPHGAPEARNRFSILAVSCLRAHAISSTRISNRPRSRR